MNEGRHSNQKLYFRDHLPTFPVVNKPKGSPLTERLKNNFDKLQKTEFLTLKRSKVTLSGG